MEAYAKSRPGVPLVQLTVSDGNRAAQALYKSYGFVPFGCEPYAIAVGDASMPKVHMWHKLSDQRPSRRTSLEVRHHPRTRATSK